MIDASQSTVDFYRKFLMGRRNFKPQEFGVDMDRDRFDELMVQAFHAEYRDFWTIDELLLHPRDAALFCDKVRHENRFYDLPDDIILRVILGHRKNP